MIKVCRSDGFVVFVVDSHTSRIVSSCCRMYDVMDAGVIGKFWQYYHYIIIIIIVVVVVVPLFAALALANHSV